MYANVEVEKRILRRTRKIPIRSPGNRREERGERGPERLGGQDGHSVCLFLETQVNACKTIDGQTDEQMVRAKRKKAGGKREVFLYRYMREASIKVHK